MRTPLVVVALLAAAGAAAAQTEPPPPLPPPQPAPMPLPPPVPRPFARGTMTGGGVLGLSTGGGRTDFVVGGNYGYYVLDGVSPGLSALFTVSDVAPTTLEIAPYVRLVPWRAYPISPILIVRGGYLIVSDGYEDVWFIGGGGGVAIFSSPRVAFTIEGIYTRYFQESPVLQQDDFALSVGVGVYF